MSTMGDMIRNEKVLSNSYKNRIEEHQQKDVTIPSSDAITFTIFHEICKEALNIAD